MISTVHAEFLGRRSEPGTRRGSRGVGEGAVRAGVGLVQGQAWLAGEGRGAAAALSPEGRLLVSLWVGEKLDKKSESS